MIYLSIYELHKKYNISVHRTTELLGINESAYLCAEVGAICEAHKLNKKVTHSLCVCRLNDGEDSKILSPCGICQERLFYWGNDVKCAITNDSNDIIFKSLKELQPYYWNK